MVSACSPRDVADASLDDLVRAMVGSELSAQELSPRGGRRVEGRRGPFASRDRSVSRCAGGGCGPRLDWPARADGVAGWLFGAGAQAGQLFVNGRPVKVRTPLRRHTHGMALVPDDRKARGWLLGPPCHHNIALASGAAGGLSARRGKGTRSGRLLGELGIKSAGMDQRVLYLSGGNQQKAVLANGCTRGRGVGFCWDEPTRGIGCAVEGEIYDLVRGLASRGAAVLLASSELDELLRLAERIVVDARGRIAGGTDAPEATEERIMHPQPEAFQWRGGIAAGVSARLLGLLALCAVAGTLLGIRFLEPSPT